MSGRENENGNGHGSDVSAMDSLHRGYRNLSDGLRARVDNRIVERWISEGVVPEGDPPVVLPTSVDKGSTADNFAAAGKLGVEGAVAVSKVVYSAAKTGWQEIRPLIPGVQRTRSPQMHVLQGGRKI